MDALSRLASSLGKPIQALLSDPNLISLATPYLNNLQSAGYLKKAADRLTDSTKSLDQLQTPDLAKLIPQLQQQVMSGVMTPAEAETALQQASQMQGVTSDPSSILNARKQIAALDQIGQNKGLTDADRAQMDALLTQSQAKMSQDRAAQIQQLQAQGNAGTGAELASRLVGQQTMANQGAQFGANLAQSAQARALQAIQSGLTGSTNLNQTLFNQEAQKATAQDAINQFNAQARNQMNAANAQRQQEANLQNFQKQFDVMQSNTVIENQQKMLPYNTAQQSYQNQLDRAKALSTANINAGKEIGKLATDQIGRSGNAAQGYANQEAITNAANTSGTTPAAGSSGSNTLSKIGQGIGVAKGAYDLFNAVPWSSIGSWFSDEELKTDKQEMTDDDVDDMIGKLTAYKYRYKGSPSLQTGVMAQDIEEINPTAVVDTPAGKQVSQHQMMGPALAMIANQNDRIRKLEGKNNG
jgi:hypothetical protein